MVIVRYIEVPPLYRRIETNGGTNEVIFQQFINHSTGQTMTHSIIYGVLDTEITGYLTNLGNKLIAGSSEARPDQTFEFFSLTDPSVNAFALPGGFMGFNSGLIMTAQSESELAGVMAHEISHVTQKHLARMISTQKYSMATTLASLALAVLASRANSQA